MSPPGLSLLLTAVSWRKFWRRLAWAFGGLLLLWLVLWLGLPPLLKWQLQKQGSAALGRAVTLQRVEVRPWAMSVAIEGLQVANAAGDAPQFSLARLFVDLELQSVLRLAPVIDALRLDTPVLHLRHLGDGRLDVDDVLARLAPPGAPTEPGGTPRFALFNIELVNGAMDLVDESVGTTHRLDGLQLAIPFLSNLGSRREVVTEPRLAFVLNGSAFDTRASTTPFAEDRQTRVRLQIPDLDVAPYLVYWPRQLPARLDAAHLHLDLTLDFEQQASPTLVASGTVGISGVRTSAQEQPLLAWQRLDVDVRRVELLRQRAEIARVTLTQPVVDVSREAKGRLNWQALFAGLPEGAAAAPASSPSTNAWTAVVDEVVVADGGVRWRDATLTPAAELALQSVEMKATGIGWPVQQAIPVTVEARLGDTPLRLQGEATDAQARVGFDLGELPLSIAAPYLSGVLVPALDGRLQAQGQIEWQAASETAPAVLQVEATQARIDELRLGSARAPLARLQRLELAAAQVDLVGQRLSVGRIGLQSPVLDVRRTADGRWMAQDWLRAPASPGSATTAPTAAEQTWAVLLSDVVLEGGRLRFTDEVPAQPVALALNGLAVRLQNLQPLASKPPDATLQVKAQVQPLQGGAAGSLALDGRLQPPGEGIGVGLRGRVQVQRLPLHALVPYVADRLNVELLRADASVRGDVNVSLGDAGPTLDLAVDAALEDLRANSLAPAEELLNWSSLQMRGLRVRSAPGQAASVALGEAVLSDYFARVVIDEQGRINLQGLLKPPAEESASTPAVTSAQAPAPDIRIGPISLVNGQVRFSDRFIRPNYTANLSELTGSLSAFSSTPPAAGQPPALAELSLKGRAEGTAQLDISGQINPLAAPLVMDIKGQVRNLELPPLSPYSAKYAGYGIERGKLSVDVRYRIDPDGKLDASNQIVLNQLGFGERDAASSANLPVKLAVALLADRDGVIDINLPVSGSLNDPEFRLGPIIVRLIFNLIGKAITAPFSLIASAFSAGGADASQLAFDPGQSGLDDSDRRQLEAVAKALENRPALRLTIVGQADLESERSGWQRARLDGLLQAEKRRRLARNGATVPAVVRVEPAEREALLREAYRRADIPKPRNFIGLVKDIPLPEMEALLLAAQVPDAQAMHDLAVARAIAVKDFLIERQLGEDRLFLGAPRTSASSGQPAPGPRVELQLATR